MSSDPRCLRTVWVMSRSLSVISSGGAVGDRRGGGDDRRPVGRAAELGLGPPGLARVDDLGPGVGLVDGGLDEIGGRFRADERIEAAVERARDVLGPRLRWPDRAADRSGRSVRQLSSISWPSAP